MMLGELDMNISKIPTIKADKGESVKVSSAYSNVNGV